MAQTTQTITQQQTIADTAGSWSQSLTFDQFDPSLGTLLNVNVCLAGDVTGSIDLENLEAASANFSLALPGWISLQGPDGSQLATVGAEATASVTLGAFDGVLDYAGNSGIVVADVSNTATQDVALQPGTTGIAGLVGAGTVDLPVEASTALSVSGPANMQILSHASAGAVVTLSEDYSPPQDSSSDSGDGVITSTDIVDLFNPIGPGSPGSAPPPYVVTSAPQTLLVADQTTGWTENLAAQQFDPTLGALAQVTLVMSSDIDGSIAAENLDPGAGFLSVYQTATVTLDAPGASGPLSTQASVQRSASLGAYDGSMDFLGPSGFIDQGLTSTSVSGFEDVTGDLGAYTGTGTVDLPVVSSSSASLSGPGNLLARLQAEGGATVTVFYTYQPLPYFSDSGDVAAYSAGGTVAADPGLTLSEPDVPLLSAASVSVTGGALVPLAQASDFGSGNIFYIRNINDPPAPLGDDVLTADTTGTDISASYDPTTEILTLTGTASVADYQQVLRSVAYSSTAADPSGGGTHTSRTLTWSATDVHGDTGTETTTIAIPAEPPAWTSGTSGDWADGANWSSTPNAPAADQDVVISAPGTYSITVSALQSVHSVTFDAPGATLVLDASLDVTAGFTLEAGTLSFDGGTLSAASFDLTGGVMTGQTVDITTPGASIESTVTLGQPGSVIQIGNTVTAVGDSIANLGSFTLADSGSLTLADSGGLSVNGAISADSMSEIAQEQMLFVAQQPPSEIAQEQMLFIAQQPASESGLISPLAQGFDPAQLAMYDPTDSGWLPDWQVLPLNGLPDDAAPACILQNAGSGNWVEVSLQQAGALNSGVAIDGGDRNSLGVLLSNLNATLG